ncbi:hypothetical protein U9M48_012254 [Paspalum notatum var. saurae]|uniref:Uncharacterized protein n=1 Tax=Paspalum notatum var. saurae TaxID=547442 RepID=A0AAQ3SXG9_PASNO
MAARRAAAFCPSTTKVVSEDILAAFDDAIADGVDVLSASLGTMLPFDYAADPMASRPSFSAERRHHRHGGPSSPRRPPRTGRSSARRVLGSAINVFPNLGKPSLLVDSKPEHFTCNKYTHKYTTSTAPPAGAVVFRFMDEDSDTAFSFARPTVLLRQEDYGRVLDYYNSSGHPVATVNKSAAVKDTAAPGHQRHRRGHPGGVASVSGSDVDARTTAYNIISSTSMACPHVTGAAAYVKSIHPGWSHAAVLSALVTTATPMAGSGSVKPHAELAYGADQVSPLRARYPSLVYDAGEADYVAFLCAQGYNASQLAAITGRASAACPGGATATAKRAAAVGDLNYPSIAVPVLNYGTPFAAEFPRTVTNVGPADSVYRATVTSVPGIDVTVTPDELAFSAGNKKLSFTVGVSGMLASVNGSIGASAAVVWSDRREAPM